jgi:hypothetical protein
MQDRVVGTISIQYLPYPEEQDKSKQLQAGQFLFPGFVRRYEPAYRTVPGRGLRYYTGLEVDDFPEAEKEEIAKVKTELESYFGKDTLDPFNEAFWKDRILEITKKTTFLDVIGNPEHRLFYHMIKGGAFKEIAPNHEQAVDRAEQKRWYLVDASQFAEISTEDERKKNKAIAQLELLEEEKPFDDMFIIHKALVTSDKGVTKRTPKAILYKDLNDFIEGKLARTQKKMTAKQFLDTVELLKKDKKKLFLAAYVKEGTYFNFLSVSDDNQIKNQQTGTKLGGTIEKAVAYLANPANQSELDNIKERVEAKWSE